MVHVSPLGELVPVTLPLHEMLLAAIRDVIRDSPDKKALISGFDDSDFLTFQQVHDQAYAVSAFLASDGFLREVACTVVRNCISFPCFMLGVLMRGGAISGASPLFAEDELERQFVESECSLIFTDAEALERVLTATRLNARVKRYDRPAKGRNPDSSKLLLDARDEATHVKRCPPYGDIEWSAETTLHILPSYHIYGMGRLSLSLLAGTTSVMLATFEPRQFCRCLEKYKIKHVSVAPPLLVFFAKSPVCDEFDLASLAIIQSGGAPAGRDLCEEKTLISVLRRLPNLRGIELGYGLTETSSPTHYIDSDSRHKHGTIGKLLPGMAAKIINVETGVETTTPAIAGELCMRGPSIMRGYLKRPDSTAQTIRGGWLHTGDIAYVDSDGDFFIVDRLKELIKVKGFQVAPAELEDVLLSHPLIADAAVIGVPDGRAGEWPAAFVVRKEKTLSEEDVARHIRDKVAPYKQLRGGVSFVSAIPKSPSGKILRRTLREQLTMTKAKI